MTDISKRIKALFFLRAIFLLSLVTSLGSFILEGIALSFGEGHVFSAAGGMTIYVLTTIFTILRLLAIVLVMEAWPVLFGNKKAPDAAKEA